MIFWSKTRPTEVFVTSIRYQLFSSIVFYALVVDQYYSDVSGLIVKMEKKERSEVIKLNMK